MDNQKLKNGSPSGQEIDKTEKMLRFEEETGKKAIWDGKITQQFIKWEKGEKIYQKSKEDIRWTVYAEPEQNEKWTRIRKKLGYKKAELMRKALNFYSKNVGWFENYGKNPDHNNLKTITKSALDNHISSISTTNSEISIELKQSLTPLKAFIQLTIDLLSKINEEEAIQFLKDAKNSCDELETKINKFFNKSLDLKKLIEPDYDILYVEDDIATANAVKTYFSRIGVKLKHAENAEEALEELKFHKPKIIIIDLGLPGKIQGDELYEKIISSEKHPELKVIFISAKPKQELDQIKAMDRVEGFINKPFDLSDLDVVLKYLKS